MRSFVGGSWWIRTTEALSSRFTVCPHWPLGKAPLSSCLRSTSECLIIIAKESGKCKPFFEFFSIFFERFWNECGFVHFWKIRGCHDAENALFPADFFKCYWRIINQSGDLQFIIPSAIIKKLYGECCTMNLVILAAVYDCQGYYLGAGEKLYEGYITASSLRNRLLPKRQNKIDSVCLCSSVG